MKNWKIIKKAVDSGEWTVENVVQTLLENRGLVTKKEINDFISPPDPSSLRATSIDIDAVSLKQALKRIQKAIVAKESIVVYADYDADGITAGAVMWETLHALGASVMPYIPHRAEEGYGLSIKGIDAVREQYDPTLIITVDHGVTAWEKVEYAKSLGIDVIITDHHVLPDKLPDSILVHTTKLSGAGVSWFLSKELLTMNHELLTMNGSELLVLSAIGTIADMVPLVGPNRSIAKYGLDALNKTSRVGLQALIDDAGLSLGALGVYDISHMIAPRLNAMGRLEHALDALRLLCTKQKDKALILAQKLGMTNKERQQLTVDSTAHALQGLSLRTQGETLRKLLFVVHESYNQGVIGLVAGKLVEQYYRPSIVVAVGELMSKASARSITGFNIVEAIRSCSDLLIDVGGHPMAAGFTVETKNLGALQARLEELADHELDEEKLTRTLRIDAEIPMELATEKLWHAIEKFQPFGFGNHEPVFASTNVRVVDARLVGADGKHLKLKFRTQNSELKSITSIDAIGFGLGSLYGKLKSDQPVDIAYSIDRNTWNGNSKLQLKVKDIHAA